MLRGGKDNDSIDGGAGVNTLDYTAVVFPGFEIVNLSNSAIGPGIVNSSFVLPASSATGAEGADSIAVGSIQNVTGGPGTTS